VSGADTPFPIAFLRRKTTGIQRKHIHAHIAEILEYCHKRTAAALHIDSGRSVLQRVGGGESVGLKVMPQTCDLFLKRMLVGAREAPIRCV